MIGDYLLSTLKQWMQEDLPEGDEINMCKAMDQLFQRFENQGIEKGKLNTLKDLKIKELKKENSIL